MTTTMYLVRHGTTYENKDRVFQGVLDTQLTEDGLRQAEEMGEYFKDIPIDCAYTSPLSRARLTMKGALKYHPEITPEIIDGLHEIEGGELQGLDFDTCNRRFDNIMITFKENPSAFAPPGGESLPEVYRRFTKTILDIVRDNPGKTILVTSHGTAIQTWLNYARGNAPEDIHFEFLPNGAISRFSFDDDGKITIDFVGDISYMKEAPDPAITP